MQLTVRNFRQTNWTFRVLLALVIIASISLYIYYVKTYRLMGPWTIDYVDSDFYYLLGASEVFSEENTPFYGHPGLNLTLLLSWSLFLLRKIGVLQAFSPSEMLAVNNPIKEIFYFLTAGRILNIALAVIYLSLIYAISQKLSKNRALSLLVVFFNVVMVGLLEQMFIVRPELLSTIFILLPLLLHLQYGSKITRKHEFICAFLVAGFLLGNALLAKIQTLFFAPPLLFLFFQYIKRNYDIDRSHYLTYTALTISLGAALAWNFVENVDAQYLYALIPQTMQTTRDTMPGIVMVWEFFKTTSIAILSCFLVLLILASINWHSNRLTQYLRNLVLLITSFTAGTLASLLPFYLNASPSKMVWAKNLVLSSVGYTIYMNFFSFAFLDNPPSIQTSFLLNKTFLHVVGEMTSFVAIFLCGFYFTNGKERICLLMLFSFLWVFSCANTMRYNDTLLVYQYEIYILSIISIILAISAKNAVQKLRGHLKLAGFAAAVIVVLIALDISHAASRRHALFPRRRNTLHELKFNETAEKGYFYEKVLKPRFCLKIDTKKECHRKIDSIVSEQQRLYETQNRVF